MRNQETARHSRQSEADRKESRRFRRVPCAEGTHFITRRRLHEGVIRNFSRGGTYIEADGFFTAGQEVTVAGPFAVGGEESKQKGSIVRYDGKGIAVKFAQPLAAS